MNEEVKNPDTMLIWLPRNIYAEIIVDDGDKVDISHEWTTDCEDSIGIRVRPI